MAKTTKLVGYGISFDMKLVGGTKTADDFTRVAKSVQKGLNSASNATKSFEIAQDQLNQALRNGAISQKEYEDQLTRLRFRELKREEQLENQRRAVLGLDRQESILAKNRQNRARMAGMAAAGVSGLGMGGRAAGAARFLGGIAGLGGPATALGAGFAGLSLIKSSTQAFARFESQLQGMKTLFGEDLAGSLVSQFRSLAGTTILTNEQLIENSRIWASYGLTTDGLTERLKMLGTVAGGNSEKFRALTIAFAQVNAQGKLMGQEKNQLINAGFSLKAVADAAGISMTDFADAMKNGEITADHLNEALVRVTSEGGLFAGYLEKQAETLVGKWTILTSTWNEFLVALGQAEEGPLGGVLDIIIEAADELRDAAEWWLGTQGAPGGKPGRIPGAIEDVPGAEQTFGARAAGRGQFFGGAGGGMYFPSGRPDSESALDAANQADKERLDAQEAVAKKEKELRDKAFKRYMEDVYAAEGFIGKTKEGAPTRLERTGTSVISDAEQQRLFQEAEKIDETFGDAARVTFQKAFPEVFDKEFAEKFVGPMEATAIDIKKMQEDKEKTLLLKEEALLNAKMEHAKTLFDRENERLDAEEKAVEEQFKKDKALAKAPQGVSFRGGSVEEFQFLRQMTQRSEEAQAIREAAAKAEAQRDRINGERKTIETDHNNLLQDLKVLLEDIKSEL